MRKRILASLVAVMLGLMSAQSTQAQMLIDHPAIAAVESAQWNRQLGNFGESIVRETLEASGHRAVNLNVGDKGIDSLVRTTLPDGRVQFRVVEVKTLQNGTDFKLGQTDDGLQLSRQWIEKRLAKAAQEHVDDEARKLAQEALEHLVRDSSSIRAELHGISIADNRYVVKAVDTAAGTIQGEISKTPLKKMLENLAEKATNRPVRDAALRHISEFDQLQAASRQATVAAQSAQAAEAELTAARSAAAAETKATQTAVEAEVKALQTAAAAETRATQAAIAAESNALRTAAVATTEAAQSTSGKLAAKALPVAATAAVVAGAGIEIYQRGSQILETEKQFAEGKISDQDRVTEHAKTVAGCAGGLSGVAAGVATLGAAGASAGAVFGPAGAAVGGCVGGAGGAAIGYVGGEKAAEAVVDYGKNTIYRSVNGIRGAGSWVKRNTWDYGWGRK